MYTWTPGGSLLAFEGCISSSGCWLVDRELGLSPCARVDLWSLVELQPLGVRCDIPRGLFIFSWEPCLVGLRGQSFPLCEYVIPLLSKLYRQCLCHGRNRGVRCDISNQGLKALEIGLKAGASAILVMALLLALKEYCTFYASRLRCCLDLDLLTYTWTPRGSSLVLEGYASSSGRRFVDREPGRSPHAGVDFSS
ncbi:hypothetical protein B296_00023329 [Ensete ventricosum]|uniref:Uncharacterized protein n=1 Tax=Ensete ventricosum TaxID=4639 RepID=A0A426Y6B5_ENSVE|nr:hypothetical protein B296_00023329 [Ensete ventricosum]